MEGEAGGKFGSPADRFSDKFIYFTVFVLLLAIGSSVLSLQACDGCKEKIDATAPRSSSPTNHTSVKPSQVKPNGSSAKP